MLRRDPLGRPCGPRAGHQLAGALGGEAPRRDPGAVPPGAGTAPFGSARRGARHDRGAAQVEPEPRGGAGAEGDPHPAASVGPRSGSGDGSGGCPSAGRQGRQASSHAPQAWCHGSRRGRGERCGPRGKCAARGAAAPSTSQAGRGGARDGRARRRFTRGRGSRPAWRQRVDVPGASAPSGSGTGTRARPGQRVGWLDKPLARFVSRVVWPVLSGVGRERSRCGIPHSLEARKGPSDFRPRNAKAKVPAIPS